MKSEKMKYKGSKNISLSTKLQPLKLPKIQSEVRIDPEVNI